MDSPQYAAAVERQILALLLNYPSALGRVRPRLDAMRFADRRHVEFYSHLRELSSSAADAALADLLLSLERDQRETAFGGREYVISLLDEPGSMQISRLDGLIEAMATTHESRQTRAALEAVQAELADGRIGPTDVARVVTERMAAIPRSAPDGEPVFQNMRELLTANLPERPTLVAGLMNTASVVLLAAPPKSGKSRLARQLALSVVSGGTFLGHQVTHPGPAYVIAYEGHKRSIRDQIHVQSASMGVTEAQLERFHLATRPESRSQKITIGRGRAWAELLEALKRDKAPLVIVDTLSKARVDGIKEDSADDVSEHVMEPVLQAVRETGATFVLLHHYRKQQSGSSSGDPADRIRGSSVFRAEAETNITMEELGDPGEGRFRLHFEQRDLPEISMEILSNQEALTFEPVAATSPVAPQLKLTIDQIERLASNTSPLDISMISSHFGVTESVAKATALQAAKEGRMRHEQSGAGPGTRHLFHAISQRDAEIDPYHGKPPFS